MDNTTIAEVEIVTGTIIYEDVQEWIMQKVFHMLPMTKIHTVEHYQNAIIIIVLIGFIFACCFWSCFTKFLWKAQMFGMIVIMLSIYQLYTLGFWLEYVSCN